MVREIHTTQKAPQNKKENGEKIKHFSFDLPASLHAKLKIAAVKEDRTMGDYLRDLLIEKLK